MSRTLKKGDEYIPQRHREFVDRAMDAHGDKYSYPIDGFRFISQKVPIICPTHGLFWQVGLDHVNGRGCVDCGNEYAKRLQVLNRKTTELFIGQARAVHGDKYDYSNTVYIKANVKVSIVCPVHGKFVVSPNHHLGGVGCKACRKPIVRSGYTLEKFISRSTEVHGDRYDYSLVKYVNQSTPVCIICRKHGEFYQTPYNHTAGHGCTRCGYEKNGRDSSHGWARSKYVKQHKDKTCFLYVVRIWEKDVEFFKVGITSRSVHTRFLPCKMPLQYETILVRKGAAGEVWDMEMDILKHGFERYFPNTNFQGRTECFKMGELKGVLNQLLTYEDYG